MTATLRPAARRDQVGLDTVCDLQGIPVVLCSTKAEVGLEIRSLGSELRISPSRPVARRCTIRPMALFKNRRAYHEISAVMGRVVFARNSTTLQTYRPFSQDSNRELRKLFLCVEEMPEDDQLASPSRWANTLPAASDLMMACGVPWKAPRAGDIERLLTFAEWPVPIEACVLYGLAACSLKTGKYILEIGSFRGSSLVALALALEAAGSELPIISVDPHLVQLSNRDHSLLALKQIQQSHRLIQIPLRSDEAAKLMRPETASMIYVDGDHTYEQVRADIKNYSPLLASGGFMVFHDYGYGNHNGEPDTHPGVREAVDEDLFGHPEFQPLLSAHTMMVFRKCTGRKNCPQS